MRGSRTPRRHLALEEVGSTNTVAFEAARAGDPGSLWITAERQIAGRGRRGRAWISERGNLYSSLLLIDPAPVRHLANLPLVVALGVRNGLVRLPGLDADRVRIKWPNDILIGGAKTVGILIESEPLGDGRHAVVIGCGINVAHWPEDAPYAVTGLRREGVTASLDVIFDGFAAGVEEALTLWAAGRNFAAVRQGWLAHAAGLGEPARVNLSDGVLNGIFRELDPDGRLVLEVGDGQLHSVSAGDLFILPRAAGA